MFSRAGVGLTVAVLLIAAVGLLVVGPSDQTASGSSLELAQADGFDSTVFRIQVLANGSVRWRVQQARTLDTDEEVTQFREFASEFRSQETEAYQNFQIRAQRLTESGTDTTGRKMNASSFRRDAYVEQLGQTRGIVEMSFIWSNFTQTEDDRLVLADVFGGGWGIVEDQRLTIEIAEGYVFEEALPSPDSMTTAGNLTGSTSVTWFGERMFADERPRVVMVPADQAAVTPTQTATENDSSSGDGSSDGSTPTDGSDDGTTDDGSTAADGSTPDPGPESGDDSGFGATLPILFAVLLLGVGGAVAWYSGALSGSSDTEPDPNSGTVQPPEPTAEEPKSTIPDEELLSDEDRVVKLLEEHGGRMKQVDIVEETDWSKSKVSMLLSDMEDEDEISKLRVGRENIISLSGEEPDAARSPLDDE